MDGGPGNPTAHTRSHEDLVLVQPYNYGFSVPLAFCGKAQRAGNGHSLVKRCNTATGRQGSARGVSLSAPRIYVAPLGKGAAIPCKARLALNADKLTELAIMRLNEHY